MRDERLYNLAVINDAGKYIKDNRLNPNIVLTAARQARTITGFYRLHASQSTSLGGTPTLTGTPGTNVCKLATSAAQISCLVKASPCSVGYGRLDIVDQLPASLDNFAFQLGSNRGPAEPPTHTNVLAVLDPLAATYYPATRGLWVNHWNDPTLPAPGSAPNEEILYSCFGTSAITDPQLIASSFLPLPTGPIVRNLCPLLR